MSGSAGEKAKLKATKRSSQGDTAQCIKNMEIHIGKIFLGINYILPRRKSQLKELFETTLEFA